MELSLLDDALGGRIYVVSAVVGNVSKKVVTLLPLPLGMCLSERENRPSPVGAEAELAVVEAQLTIGVVPHEPLARHMVPSLDPGRIQNYKNGLAIAELPAEGDWALD